MEGMTLSTYILSSGSFLLSYSVLQSAQLVCYWDENPSFVWAYIGFTMQDGSCQTATVSVDSYTTTWLDRERQGRSFPTDTLFLMV